MENKRHVFSFFCLFVSHVLEPKNFILNIKSKSWSLQNDNELINTQMNNT